MKKITFIMLALILPFISNAQNFDKYENMKNVDAVVVTSQMIKLLTRVDLNADDPETQKYLELIENLDELKVFTSTEEDVRLQMSTDVATFLQNGSMQELMRVSDGGKSVKFYYKPGRNEDYVSQLFMFMEGNDDDKRSVILNITGDINLNQISRLAQDLKIPGGEQLKNSEIN